MCLSSMAQPSAMQSLSRIAHRGCFKSPVRYNCRSDLGQVQRKRKAQAPPTKQRVPLGLRIKVTAM